LSVETELFNKSEFGEKKVKGALQRSLFLKKPEEEISFF